MVAHWIYKVVGDTVIKFIFDSLPGEIKRWWVYPEKEGEGPDPGRAGHSQDGPEKQSRDTEKQTGARLQTDSQP